ncbi:MAG: hypothetical protein JWN15_2373 [Firmicutes bacterium]|nr:hypothetical protein [Bacillota bacterium]
MQAAIAMRGQRLRTLVPGVGLWIALAAGGGIWAAAAGRPVLPLIVTLDEWVAALFFLAPLLAFMLSLGRSESPQAAAQVRFISVAVRLGWAASAVFVLDLITRAIFGLGWKPF